MDIKLVVAQGIGEVENKTPGVPRSYSAQTTGNAVIRPANPLPYGLLHCAVPPLLRVLRRE